MEREIKKMQMKKKTFSHDIWNDHSLKEKKEKKQSVMEVEL